MRHLLTLLAAALLSAPAAAQMATAPPVTEPAVSAIFAEVPPRVDGVLDDPVWEQAVPITDFRQRQPVDMGEPSERTEMRVLYDAENLYVGIELFDREPEKIRANVFERGGRINRDDHVWLALDTYLDRRNAYIFEVNPLGTQDDALVTDENAMNWDWNGVFRSEGRITDEGWALEIAIPFKTIRFSSEDAPKMGIALVRRISRKNEEVIWPPIPRSYGAGIRQVSQYAVLDGLQGLRRGRGVTVKPYALAGAQTAIATGVPRRNDFVRDVGVDVKWGITSSLLLDLTLNTDFAQVEADAAQVNLTRFNLFFPEKREFFLERSGLFTFGSPGETETFFSRRIGLRNTILGGARLTGQAGPLSLGVLNLQTLEENGVEGANYGVARFRADVLPRTTVGTIFTNVEAPGYHNRAAGIDGVLRFWGSSSLTGWFTNVWETGEAPQNRAGAVRLRLQNDLYSGEVSYSNVGRGFNPGIGFVRRLDMIRYEGELGYRPLVGDGGGLVRRFTFDTEGTYITGQDGRVQSTGVEGEAFILFRAQDRIGVVVEREFERLDEAFSIRPEIAVPAGDYTFASAGLRAYTDESRRVFGRLNLDAGGFFDGTQRGASGLLGFRFSKHFKTETSLQLAHVALPAGSFDAAVLGLRIEAAASRALFARALIQYDNFSRLWRANVRLNWIHTPGSDLFVVFNTSYRFDPEGNVGLPTYFRPNRYHLNDRTGVVKLTYLIAI